MRILFVHAHPVAESFSTALFKAAVETAQSKGHDIRVIDLHAEGFNPVMSSEERSAYTGDGPPPADIVPHIANLQWAEGIILVYPTWWYSQPAILKGWVDRVWRPGIAFTLRSATEPLRPALTNVRLIGVITTFGSPWWFWTFLMGAPGRKIILRGMRYCTASNTKTFWMGLHDMDNQTDRDRRRFLDRVKARISSIPL